MYPKAPYPKVLARSFYERPTIEVARDLLGKILIHGKTSGRIIETGTFDELVRLGGKFAELARTQFMTASVTQ